MLVTNRVLNRDVGVHDIHYVMFRKKDHIIEIYTAINYQWQKNIGSIPLQFKTGGLPLIMAA